MGFRELARSHSQLIQSHNAVAQQQEAMRKDVYRMIGMWNAFQQMSRWQRFLWLWRGGKARE